MHPEDLVRYAKSVLAAILFGSNLFFYGVQTEYGATSSLLKPLLHTWSLGVEAQIYLLLPVLLLVLCRWCRRRLVLALALLAVAGLVVAEVLVARDADLAFYLPFARLWEICLGSLLAARELNDRSRPALAPAWLLPLAGLGLIGWAVVGLGGGPLDSGHGVAMAVLGAVLVIGTASTADPVGRVLASRPLVGLGLISYSVYLWHYSAVRVRPDPVWGAGVAREARVDRADDRSCGGLVPARRTALPASGDRWSSRLPRDLRRGSRALWRLRGLDHCVERVSRSGSGLPERARCLDSHLGGALAAR